MKLFKKIILSAVILMGLLPFVVSAGRTDNAWDNMTTYLKTNVPTGLNILINGVNKYLNFGATSGSSGYGFRDNSGTMQFKNSLGAWTDVGSGGIQTETDPIYSASSWFTTTNNSSNWNTAYGWGNHASAGYLTSFTETDPLVYSWAKSATKPSYSLSELSDDATHRLVTDTEKSTWNGKQTAYSILSTLGGLANASGVLNNDGSGNLSWGAGGSMTYPSSGIPLSTGSAWGTSITNNSANWNTAYGWGNWASNFGTTTGTIAQGNDSRIANGQTAYGWGNHASAGYVTGTPWTSMGYLTSYTETDPTIYAWAKASTKPTYTYSEVGAQVAGTYSTDIHSNITALNAVSGTNTGDNATNSQYSGLASSKQDTLVSATNIKTINGSSVLGSGDLTVSPSIPTPVIRTYNANNITMLGDTSNVFTMSIPVAGTCRWTYNSGGTNPNINATTFPVGTSFTIGSYNLNAGNRGSFTVTGSGSNYMEASNASCYAQSNITLYDGYLYKNPVWTKPAGLKYIITEVQGGGESGGRSSPQKGFSTIFKSMTAYGGGSTETLKGGSATGGDINIKGHYSMYWTGFTTNNTSYTRSGKSGADSYFGVGGYGDLDYGGASCVQGEYGSGGGGDYYNGGGQGGYGGSSGGYARKLYLESALSATENVVIGGGGSDGGGCRGGHGMTVITEYY